MRARTTTFAALLALLLALFSPALGQNSSGQSQESRTAGNTSGQTTGDWQTAELPEIEAAPAVEPEIFQADYGYGIVIEGEAEYVQGMTDLLDSMALLPSGQALLEELGETGFSTTIRPLTPEVSDGPAAGPNDPANATFLVGDDGQLVPGPGSDASVWMNPDSTIARTSPEIVLGHELLHALHYHHGERLNAVQTEGPNAGTKFEELRTIGTDGYDDEPISENRLRAEWNELYPDNPVAPERNGHGARDWGPSRTAPACNCGIAGHPHVQPATPSMPLAVEPQVPLEVKPIQPIEVAPIVIEPAEDSTNEAEGASQILGRALSGGQ